MIEVQSRINLQSAPGTPKIHNRDMLYNNKDWRLWLIDNSQCIHELDQSELYQRSSSIHQFAQKSKIKNSVIQNDSSIIIKLFFW